MRNPTPCERDQAIQIANDDIVTLDLTTEREFQFAERVPVFVLAHDGSVKQYF